MQIGQAISNVKLPAISGNDFSTDSLKGKPYLLTFFRFATCPFCNMRIAQLVKEHKSIGEQLEFVAIFESDIKHLTKHASKHVAQFPILADKERQYYDEFGVKKSLWGMLYGMVFRMPTAMMAMAKGYLPHEVSSRFLTMPLSILVDGNGIIQAIYHGKDEGDHMPLTQIREFAQSSNNTLESAPKAA